MWVQKDDLGAQVGNLLMPFLLADGLQAGHAAQALLHIAAHLRPVAQVSHLPFLQSTCQLGQERCNVVRIRK